MGGKRKEAEMKEESKLLLGFFFPFQCHLLPPSSFLPLFDSFLVSPLLVYSPLPAVFFPDHPLSLKTPCSASCCVFPARHFHSSEIQLNILAALSAPSDKHRNLHCPQIPLPSLIFWQINRFYSHLIYFIYHKLEFTIFSCFS